MASICIPIRNSEDEQDTIILFPLVSDQDLTLDDLRSAFPSLTSLRYKDSDENLIHHVLCRNGIMIEPAEGWIKEGRIYIAMKEENNANSRFGTFEYYRKKIRNVTKDPKGQSQQKIATSSGSKESGYTNVKVSHGHFKAGVFSRISATNLSGIGGCVVVGPFSKTNNTSVEIRDAAFEKFCCVHSGFKRKYKSKDNFYLVYPDGKLVNTLPDGSTEFSLQGYRDFLDPQKRFDRLRLYLCEKENHDMYSSVELLSDSNSSSDELPTITVPGTSRVPRDEASSYKNDEDDTLPLVVNVKFHFGDKIFEESYPNNTKAYIIIRQINRKLETTVKLRVGDSYISEDDRLMQLTATDKLDVYVETIVRPEQQQQPMIAIESIEIPAAYNIEVDVEPIVEQTLRDA